MSKTLFEALIAEGFTAGYIGEVESTGKVAYFRTVEGARQHCEKYYPAWVPKGATYLDD